MNALIDDRESGLPLTRCFVDQFANRVQSSSNRMRSSRPRGVPRRHPESPWVHRRLSTLVMKERDEHFEEEHEPAVLA